MDSPHQTINDLIGNDYWGESLLSVPGSFQELTEPYTCTCFQKETCRFRYKTLQIANARIRFFELQKVFWDRKVIICFAFQIFILLLLLFHIIKNYPKAIMYSDSISKYRQKYIEENIRKKLCLNRQPPNKRQLHKSGIANWDT